MSFHSEVALEEIAEPFVKGAFAIIETLSAGQRPLIPIFPSKRWFFAIRIITRCCDGVQALLLEDLHGAGEVGGGGGEN